MTRKDYPMTNPLLSTITKVILAAGLATFASSAAAQIMPLIKAADLNKRTVTWPRGLPADRTLIIVAFSGSQQKNIDRWVGGMRLKEQGAPAWFEVPLINDPGSVGRWFIDNGMRGGISNPNDRARVVTVYADKKAMMKSLGLPNETQVHLLVVDRSGRVLQRVSGDYSPAGETILREALKG
jgi:hypothetical protein